MNNYDQLTCRLCNNKNLKEKLSLNDSPLCDEYLKEKQTQKNYPLALNLCKSCDFVQLSHVVPPEIIYKNYIYVTNSSPGLKNHFMKYAEDVSKNLFLNNNSLVIDIGSNDGTLLSCFKHFNNNVIGIEPSKKAADIANNNGIKTYANFFNKSLALEIVKNHKKADVITVNNLFANIEDLKDFITNIKLLLNDQGVFIIESSYLFKMIDNMVFDFIYHEHLSYLSIKPLQKWLSKNDLILFDVSNIETKGGSIRYYIAKKQSSWQVKSEALSFYTNEPSGVQIENIFLDFKYKIAIIKNDLHNILNKYKDKRIIGYGASATSTTMISEFNLYNYIEYLVDDNESKIGTFSPGYHIPVYNPEILINEKPDLIIILAWRFAEEIKIKLKNLNIPILIPLPTVQLNTR